MNIKISTFILLMILHSFMTRLYGVMTTSSPLYLLPPDTNIMLFNITDYIERNKIFGCDNRYDFTENAEAMYKINLIHKQNEILKILNGTNNQHMKLQQYDEFRYLFDVGICSYNISKGGLMDDFNIQF